MQLCINLQNRVSMQRNRSLDIAKGIGIISVVYGHCGDIFGHYIIYMFHMPLFFFISGCLHKDRPLTESIQKKLRSLLVPYITFWTICLLIDMVFLGGGRSRKSILL